MGLWRHDPSPKPISINCQDCGTLRRIDHTMCEIVRHPDGIARLSWTCIGCGAQLRNITGPDTVQWMQDVGVPVADWTHIDPWMDRPRDWTPLTALEVEDYANIARDGARFNVALRTLLEGRQA